MKTETYEELNHDEPVETTTDRPYEPNGEDKYLYIKEFVDSLAPDELDYLKGCVEGTHDKKSSKMTGTLNMDELEAGKDSE